MSAESGGRSMICVVCPIGCRLRVEPREDGPPQVSGNRCKRGLAYATSELKGPRRVLTAAVRLERPETVPGRDPPSPAMLPCKSSAPIPMELIPAVLAELRELSPRPPLRAGDLMLANPADCGADILATRDVDA